MESGRGFNDLQRLDRRIREPLFAAETKWMRVVEDASLLLLLHLEQHAPNPLRILLVVLSPRAPCWAARFWYKRQQFIEGLGCFFPFGTALGVFTIVVLSRPAVKQIFGVGVSEPK